jgi:hypothetical protein
MDGDFNFENGTEGSGSDIVHYHFPLEGYTGLINVSAKVYYQALPPKWLNPMLAESTPEIDTFRTMYENADLSPVLIASQNLDSIFVQSLATNNIIEVEWLKVFPNPTNDGFVSISKPEAIEIYKVKIYDGVGRLVKEVQQDFYQIQLPQMEGLIILEIETDRGRVIRKLISN